MSEVTGLKKWLLFAEQHTSSVTCALDTHAYVYIMYTYMCMYMQYMYTHIYIYICVYT